MALDVGHGLALDLQPVAHPHCGHDFIEGGLYSQWMHHHEVEGVSVRQQFSEAETLQFHCLPDEHREISMEGEVEGNFKPINLFRPAEVDRAKPVPDGSKALLDHVEGEVDKAVGGDEAKGWRWHLQLQAA